MRGSDSHGAKIHSPKALLCRAFAHPIGFLRKKRDLVSCLITNGVFVAIKMARRSGGCRTRVPARREAVLEANGVFSFLLIRQGRGLRDRRIARTRSLPCFVRQPPDRYRSLLGAPPLRPGDRLSL
jgi:hypothetical protein